MPRLVILILLFLAPHGSVWAQPTPDPRTTARMHLGPIYATPRLAVTELGFDSNVYNGADERESDFTFTIVPSLDTWLPIARRALLTASGGVDLVYYRSHANERSLNGNVTVRGELYVNRVTFFIAESFLNTRQRLNFEVDVRSRRWEQWRTAGIAMRVSPKVRFDFSGRMSRREFDADAMFLGTSLEETLNQESRELAAGFRYALTPLTTLRVDMEGTEERFPYSPVRNTDTLRILPSVEFSPRALIAGNAAVGYRRLAARDPALPGFDGLVARAGLSYRLGGATLFGFTLDRDISYSAEPLQPYFLRNGYGGSVTRHLGGQFDLQLGVQQHKYRYRALTRSPADPPDSLASESGPPLVRNGDAPRLDTTRNYQVSLGYRIGREGRLGFGVSYWTRDSNADLIRSYDGVRLGTTFDYGF